MDEKLRNMTSVYLVDDSGILCLYRIGSRVANHKYVGSAGGHFEKDELNEPRACVLRELEEEVGLTADDLECLRLRYITLRLKNGEIRQNYYYFASLPPDAAVPQTCTEGQLEWVPINRVLSRNMPHTARSMLEHYLSEGRFTDHLYCGASTETGAVFTILNEF